MPEKLPPELPHPHLINSFISLLPTNTSSHLFFTQNTILICFCAIVKCWVEMASLTVSAPCKLSSASSSLAGMKLSSKPTGAQQHRVVMMPVKAASNASIEVEKKEDKEAMQRRSVMFAAAAAAVSAVSQGMTMNMDAMAEEPKNGTPEAKKLYARICVTMPTAKVCHN